MLRKMRRKGFSRAQAEGLAQHGKTLQGESARLQHLRKMGVSGAKMNSNTSDDEPRLYGVQVLLCWFPSVERGNYKVR